jgi:adenylosuccinate lyase
MPKLIQIVYTLDLFARKWGDVPLLARTHGQPASPTRMGKELMVFVDRLKAQMEQLESVPHCCKFGGATGNLNAHKVAFPDRDWVSFYLPACLPAYLRVCLSAFTCLTAVLNLLPLVHRGRS